MRDTEIHPPSLPKFLKQPLVVCNGVRGKKKENSAFLRHYKRPTEDKQGSTLEKIPGGFLRHLHPQTRREWPRTWGAAPATLLAFNVCLSFILMVTSTSLLLPFYRWDDREAETQRWSSIPRPPLEKDGAGIQSLAPSLWLQPWVAVRGLSPVLKCTRRAGDKVWSRRAWAHLLSWAHQNHSWRLNSYW